MNIVKQYWPVPVSGLLTGIYVKYTHKNLVHKLVTPDDGSPEVMEILEEPPTTFDYVKAVSLVMILVSVAIFSTSYMLSSPMAPIHVPLLETNMKTSDIDISSHKSRSQKPVKHEHPKQKHRRHREPVFEAQSIPRYPEKRMIMDKIRPGPADF